MFLPPFFKVLRTTSSEVTERTLFNSRSTQYVPDIFFILIHSTVVLVSAALDVFLLICLFLHFKMFVPAAVYLVTIILPGSLENYLYCVSKLKVNIFFLVVLTITGFSAAIHATLAINDVSAHSGHTAKEHLKCFTFPFFNIKNHTFCLIKIAFLINAAFKNLPRLFILPVIILQKDSNDFLVYMGVTLIMLNMVMFSMTTALTFPIRPTPRVFTSSFAVVFNAFSKFMAGMTSCCVVLVVFVTLYKRIQYYALLFPAFRTLTWTWPSWNALRLQKTPLSPLSFIIYFVFFAFFFGFTYIHPFEGIGKLNYYAFNLIVFLSEIFAMYFFSGVPLECITSYFIFRTITTGFMSNFGLINLLCKYRHEKTKYGCVSVVTIEPGMSEKSKKSETMENQSIKSTSTSLNNIK